jgi:hypothetical protein
MRIYRFLYVHYLYSNFGLFFILLCLLIFLKIPGLLIYLLLVSISVFIFFLRTKKLTIKNVSLILNYKVLKKSKVFDFKQIKTINIIHKDYSIYQIKTIELQFHNGENYKINCNGIYEEDEYEDGMFNLYLFIKEKFKNTLFIEFNLLKR